MVVPIPMRSASLLALVSVMTVPAFGQPDMQLIPDTYVEKEKSTRVYVSDRQFAIVLQKAGSEPEAQTPLAWINENIGDIPVRRVRQLGDRVLLVEISQPLPETAAPPDVIMRSHYNSVAKSVLEIPRQQNFVESVGTLLWDREDPGADDLPAIATRRLRVKFNDPNAERGAFAEANDLVLTDRETYREGVFDFEMKTSDKRTPLEAARKLSERPEVEWAYAHLLHIQKPRVSNVESPPSGPPIPDAWQHHNVGLPTGHGTRDSDIDTIEAWAITSGSSSVPIAVIDTGFDVAHPEFGGGKILAARNVTAGNDDVSEDPIHGTKSAGLAAARGVHVKGACPECSLVVIKANVGNLFSNADAATAINFAITNNVAVISNSWTSPDTNIGLEELVDSVQAAINQGIVVVASLDNCHSNKCSDAMHVLADLPEVLTIGIASDRDTNDFSAFGPCLDLLAPSRANGDCDNPAAQSTVGVATTMPGNGYGIGLGTSSAVPIASGVVGLLKSVDSSQPAHVYRRVLQDTADRIDDDNAHYATVDGFATSERHGRGRINAFEAVRLLSPSHSGGRDLMIRDNKLDWGNTEQPSTVKLQPIRGTLSCQESPDIKIDVAPTDTVATSADFENFVSEEPVAGKHYRVYVRVRNRGPKTATGVTVKVLSNTAGAITPLPNDFWTQFPNDSTLPSDWRSLGNESQRFVPYSGSSLAGGMGDDAAILQFGIPAPDDVTTMTLMAVVTSLRDSPASADLSGTQKFDVLHITPRDNNIALFTTAVLSGND